MSYIIKIELTETVFKVHQFYFFSQKTNRFKNYFCYKDLVPETLRSNHNYRFVCESCAASTTSKTYNHIKVRVSEHQGAPPRT